MERRQVRVIALCAAAASFISIVAFAVLLYVGKVDHLALQALGGQLPALFNVPAGIPILVKAEHTTLDYLRLARLGGAMPESG